MTITPQLFLVIKIGMLAVIFLFALFLGVVYKQVKSMNNIVTQPYLFPYLQTFAIIMMGVAISLFVLTLVIL